MLNIEEFKGVDLYNSPSNVDDSRSPDAPNMVRDVPGKVRKRMGYEKIDQYPGRINGETENGRGCRPSPVFSFARINAEITHGVR